MLPVHPINFPAHVPEGQAIEYVARKKNIPCQTIFLAAAGAIGKNHLPPDERLEIARFASAACQTQNPDIVWQIAQVESGFRMNIVHIEGKTVLTGKEARLFVRNELQNSDNIDLGPLQINWRANGAKLCKQSSPKSEKNSSCQPADFLKGKFSVDFLANRILKTYVKTCGKNWISCYHSYDKDRGTRYRAKIEESGKLLRRVLARFL